jgi:gamma-glutamylcyclotransferase (GGCT)/AIG2-like uncharacterized protein YtfP
MSSAVLYFAYGSNLNLTDMRTRCPDARAEAPARLRGWRLIFRGVADIEPAEGCSVYGALWWLSPRDVRSLDAYEGAPTHYLQRTLEVETDAGLRQAMTYIMASEAYHGLPSAWYLERIEEGFRDWSLPIGELQRALDQTREQLRSLGVAHFRSDGRKRLKAILP